MSSWRTSQNSNYSFHGWSFAGLVGISTSRGDLLRLTMAGSDKMFSVSLGGNKLQEAGTFGIGIREISCQKASDLISEKSFLREKDREDTMQFEGRRKAFYFASASRWKSCFGKWSFKDWECLFSAYYSGPFMTVYKINRPHGFKTLRLFSIVRLEIFILGQTIFDSRKLILKRHAIINHNK